MENKQEAKQPAVMDMKALNGEYDCPNKARWRYAYAGKEGFLVCVAHRVSLEQRAAAYGEEIRFVLISTNANCEHKV